MRNENKETVEAFKLTIRITHGDPCEEEILALDNLELRILIDMLCECRKDATSDGDKKVIPAIDSTFKFLLLNKIEFPDGYGDRRYIRAGGHSITLARSNLHPEHTYIRFCELSKKRRRRGLEIEIRNPKHYSRNNVPYSRRKQIINEVKNSLKED